MGSQGSHVTITIPKTPVRLEIDHDVPAEVQSAAVSLIRAHGDLIPPWCDRFCLGWNPEADNIAEIEVSEKYRWVKIWLSGQWLERDETHRERNILHELVHILIQPISGTAKELARDDKLAKTLVTNETEKAVCDIAGIIYRLKRMIPATEGEPIDAPKTNG